MKHQTLLLIISVLLIAGCADKSEKAVYNEIDLSVYGENAYPDISNPSPKVLAIDFKSSKVSSTQFFLSIEYIPLETNSESVFGEIDELLVTNDHYIILDKKTHGIFVFDKSGKFVNKINRKGEGPEEYRIPKSIAYNPYNGAIEVLDNTRYIIQRYDLANGDYIGTLEVGFGIQSFRPLDSEKYLFLIESYLFNENRYAQVKGLNKLVILANELSEGGIKVVSQHLTYRPNSGLFNFGLNNSLREGDPDELLLNVAFNDTVYSFTEAGFKPVYVFDYGDKNPEPGLLENSNQNELLAIFERNEIPMTSYFWQNDSIIYTMSDLSQCFFSKTGEKVACIKRSDFLQSAGAFAFPPVGVEEDKFIYVMEPGDVYDMKSSIDERIARLYPQASPSDHRTIIDTFFVQKEKYHFLELLEEKIDESSNPVLVLTKPNLELNE